MRLILETLTEKELKFLLRLLNAAGATVDVSEKFNPAPGGTRLKTTPFRLRREAYVSVSEAISLDATGDKLRRGYEKGKVVEEMRRKGAWFAKSKQDRRTLSMQEEWTWARLPLLQTVVHLRDKPGNFVQWPSIVGLPAHHPAVLINDPGDLVGWLITRGMANRQLQRFVKCSRGECGRFGLRERAKQDAHFCTKKCQKLANAESRKMKPSVAYGYALGRDK